MRFYFQTKKDAQEYWSYLVEEQRYIPMAPIEERMADARYRLKVRRSDGTWAEMEGRRNRPVFTFLTREARRSITSGAQGISTSTTVSSDVALTVPDRLWQAPPSIPVDSPGEYHAFWNPVLGMRMQWPRYIQMVNWRPLDEGAVAAIVDGLNNMDHALIEAARRQTATMGIYASLHSPDGIEIVANHTPEDLRNVIPVPVITASMGTLAYLHSLETIPTSMRVFRTENRIPVEFQGLPIPPQFREFIAEHVRLLGGHSIFYLAFGADLTSLKLVKVPLP